MTINLSGAKRKSISIRKHTLLIIILTWKEEPMKILMDLLEDTSQKELILIILIKNAVNYTRKTQ